MQRAFIMLLLLFGVFIALLWPNVAMIITKGEMHMEFYEMKYNDNRVRESR